jgi:hypothetical protein
MVTFTRRHRLRRRPATFGSRKCWLGANCCSTASNASRFTQISAASASGFADRIKRAALPSSVTLDAFSE